MVFQLRTCFDCLGEGFSLLFSEVFVPVFLSFTFQFVKCPRFSGEVRSFAVPIATY
jgi:hypothetical protein